ncbi:MAG: hypothetical protein ACFFB5_12685 [Promethearchaeota archaeon]
MKTIQKMTLKRGWPLIIFAIILLSGCVGPAAPERKPLEKVINREAENEEGYEVIAFVERADVLDFLIVEANDTTMTSINNSQYDKLFIQNISQTLLDIEQSYFHSSHYQGFLNYSIIAKFISIKNYTEISTLIMKQLRNFLVPNTSGCVGYIPKKLGINNTQIEELSLENDLINVLSKTNLSKSLWLVTVGIHFWYLDAAYRMGRWETSVYCSEICLLDPALNFAAIFTIRSSNSL